MRRFNIGDKVISEDGVIGTVIKFYVPTACEEQTLVETGDGRLYHAPTRTWVKYKDGLEPCISIIDELAAIRNELASIKYLINNQVIHINVPGPITMDHTELVDAIKKGVYSDIKINGSRLL